MQHAFKVFAVLALFLVSASAALADIDYVLISKDPCAPPYQTEEKLVYEAHDMNQQGKTIGWWTYNCDGTSEWLPNTTRIRRGSHEDGGSGSGSNVATPPVRLEVLRKFTRSLAAMQRIAGGAEISISISREIAPELGDVDKITIRVPAGMLSPRTAPVLPNLAPKSLNID